jgi:hypothetical protein
VILLIFKWCLLYSMTRMPKHVCVPATLKKAKRARKRVTLVRLLKLNIECIPIVYLHRGSSYSSCNVSNSVESPYVGSTTQRLILHEFEKNHSDSRNCVAVDSQNSVSYSASNSIYGRCWKVVIYFLPDVGSYRRQAATTTT